jgi:hypothetical protein
MVAASIRAAIVLEANTVAFLFLMPPTLQQGACQSQFRCGTISQTIDKYSFILLSTGSGPLSSERLPGSTVLSAMSL